MSQIKVQTHRTKCAKEDELGILPTCSRFFCLKDNIHALETFQYLEPFIKVAPRVEHMLPLFRYNYDIVPKMRL